MGTGRLRTNPEIKSRKNRRYKIDRETSGLSAHRTGLTRHQCNSSQSMQAGAQHQELIMMSGPDMPTVAEGSRALIPVEHPAAPMLSFLRF
jgi:hypothetical protein